MSLEKTPGAATAEEGVGQGSFQARERAVYGGQAARRSVKKREGDEETMPRLLQRAGGRANWSGMGGEEDTFNKVRLDYGVSRLPIHRTLLELAL